VIGTNSVLRLHQGRDLIAENNWAVICVSMVPNLREGWAVIAANIFPHLCNVQAVIGVSMVTHLHESQTFA
jgi:hypothetical protein